MSSPGAKIGQRIQPPPVRRLLVVAGAAAESDELLEALAERSREETIELALVVPGSEAGRARRGWAGPPDSEEATRRLRVALSRFRAAGLYVREAGVADGDPVRAAAAAAAAGSADEIVVATPGRRAGALGERLAAATGLPVSEVRASARRRASRGDRPSRRSSLGVLAGRIRDRRAPRRLSSRVLAARALAAAGLALLAIAAASAAVGDEQPPPTPPVESAPAPPR